MCSPPFFVTVEKACDRALRAAECLRPAIEQPAALVGELVGSLRRARQVGAPLRADEPLLLQRPQEPVEVADVDAPLDAKLRDPLQQLVPVQRPLTQEQQQGGFDESLDARPNVPVTGPDEPPAP